MTSHSPNSKVDTYLRKAKAWREELEKLRGIMLGCGLREELKWGKPCYTFEGSNVAVLLPLKGYCAVLFCKGALLKDAKGVLVRPTENTQAARQLRFTGVEEIVEAERTLQAYLKEAMEAEKAGLEVTYKKVTEFAVPEEFQKVLDERAEVKRAFGALTPGRQRGYLLYFSGAKQPKTREARVGKCVPRILEGKGLDD